MTIKNFLWLVAILAAIFAVLWIVKSGPFGKGKADSNFAGAGGAFASEEKLFDFGEVSMAQGKVSHEFKIKNSGSGSLTLNKIYTSCMCTEAFLLKGDIKLGPYGMPGHGFIPKIKQTLGAGEEADIQVVFDPAAHGPAGVGPIQRIVYIETSSSTETLQIKAMVKP